MSKIIEVIKAEALDDLRSELQIGVDSASDSAQAAEYSANSASDAALAAETAADVAMTAGLLYPDAATGLAERTDGDYFWVVPNEVDGIENPTLYINNDSEAIKIYELYNLESYMIEEGADWEVENYGN